MPSFIIQRLRIPQRFLVFAIVFIILFSTIFILQKGNSGNNDWDMCFYPATRRLLIGLNPYLVPPHCNFTPWALLPLIPLALFPPNIGMALLSTLGIVTLAFVAKKMGAQRLAFLAIAGNPVFIWHYFFNPNIDWLVAIGFLMPTHLGLPLVLVKPQLGACVAVFWFAETWRKNGFQAVISSFFPVTLIIMLSFLFFGSYLLQASTMATEFHVWNFAPWPWGIPLGLALLAHSLSRHSKSSAILASPFLTPYIAIVSWPVAFLGLLPRHQKLAAATFALGWLVLALLVIMQA
jgi:hypothetical protein